MSSQLLFLAWMKKQYWPVEGFWFKQEQEPLTVFNKKPVSPFKLIFSLAPGDETQLSYAH